MKAMSYAAYGDNSALEYGDVPEPKVGPGEVLVRVKAAGVNPVDWKVMSGGLDGFLNITFPAIPGWDVAGVVERVGLDAGEFSVGDEVFSYARKDFVYGGTMAEYVTVPVRMLAKKPASMTFEEAGATPLAGLTALQVLRRLSVKAGDVVLIHGASGGVGSFAVQIAKAWGATVVATASEANHEYLRELGADFPVQYGDELVSNVKAVAPEGVDVSADFVGGVTEQTQAVLREGGRFGSIADPGVMQQGGAYMWVRPSREDLGELGELIDSGKVRVAIAETFDLKDLAQAFAANQSGHTLGKIVVTP